jgi:cytochrome c-type biogenesis protein CcmH
MRAWLPAIAMGGALAVVALAVVLLLQPESAPTAADHADALARELRCPDCQGLSVADSPTGSAREIRRQIDELIAAGASADEVRAHFVARYGEWILLAPTSLLAWIIPFAVVIAGGGCLVAWLIYGRRSPPQPPRHRPTPEERRSLREEAEALDA